MQIALWIDTPALGDTIAAIPTLRKLSQAYDDQKITVFTSKPFLFEGHPLVEKALKSDADKSGYKVYKTFSHLVGKQYDQHGEKTEFRYSNMDLRQFHAVSLGFTLTEAEMDMDLYIESERELEVKDYVLIHPTHTWPTRTWDQEKWQELIDRLNAQGIPVVAVGRDAKEVGFYNTDKPVMPIDIKLGVNLLNDDSNDPAELRWMMNNRAKAVVTMDSGILHVAGTTDVNIIQLGSSIDNKLRAPYRNGSQGYKYQFVRGGCGEFCSSNMKYNIKVHGSIQGVPPQVRCLADKPAFECHPTVDQVFEAVMNLYSSQELKVPKAYITHCNEAYAPIAQKMVQTIREFSNLPIIVYMLNSDVQIEGENVITHRMDVDIRDGQIWGSSEDGNRYIDRNSPAVYDVITKKVDATIHALTHYADTVVYIDGDSVATPWIDDLFDYDNPNSPHPLFTHGLQEYMMANGKGNPFVTGPNGEEQWKIDISLTLEQPLCDLLGVNNEVRLNDLGYVQTGYFVANANQMDFLQEWQKTCQMPIIRNNATHYAPFHEETIVNVLLWKYGYTDRIPLCYINANSVETIDEVFNKLQYNGDDRQYRHGWLVTPGKKEHIKVLHGEKRPEVIDQMVQSLKGLNRVKLLYLAPHLSTGGMPEFLLGRLKALHGTPNLDIHVLEYCLYAESYVVQREQIKQMLGSNFHEIGHLGSMPDEVREFRLKEVISNLQPDVIHIEESPEAFDSFNKMSAETQEWLYQSSNPWKIVETCHNIWFNPKEGKRYSPDAYLFVTPHHGLETFSEEPSEKFEAFYPIIPQTKSEDRRRKSLEILGLEDLSNAKHIVNIGLWTPGKNQGEAVAWAQNLEALYPNQYHFHFVGNQAPNFAHYWEPIMATLPSNVHIWGERSDIDTFYQLADAVVFNSTWECNPLALRQALGYDIPVMARNLPQYHTMYNDCLTEIQGDNADHLRLVEALQTKPTRKQNAQAMAKFKQEHLDAYLKTLKGPVKRAAHGREEYTITWQNGPKVSSKTGRELKVEFWADGEMIYGHTLSGEGHWCKPSQHWHRDWTVIIDGKEHKLELEGKGAVIQFDSSSLGDTLSWIEPCVEFKMKNKLSKLYIATHKNWLFDQDHYRLRGIEFIQPGNWPEDAVAFWNVGVYMEDPPGTPWFPNRNKRDWRKIYLGDIASDHLGVKQVMKSPKLAYSGKHQQTKPYICIATASTAQAKYWNNPTGWQELIDDYTSRGYDVYHVSKEKHNLKGVKKAPEALEEVYKLLQGAECFYGISSGLSWFAWATDVPIVLISGFTPEECEFDDAKTLRIINKSVCNSCWATEHFNRGDWNWCPKHKGTENQFVCTKSITAQSVLQQVKEWQKQLADATV